MRIGIFADAHDHVDNIRRAVSEFNRMGCELVVFAGDFVSPIAVPPLRKLRAPLVACFGDSDGNKIGLTGGLRIVGTVGEAPFGFQTPDGTKILVTHVLEQLRGLVDGADVIISARHASGVDHPRRSGQVVCLSRRNGGLDVSEAVDCRAADVAVRRRGGAPARVAAFARRRAGGAAGRVTR